MTQPYAYWTLEAPFVTIVGLYSNVEGTLDARGRSDQQHYLETQLKAADPKKKLLVTVHHPPFSLDAAHGGSPDILNALDRAIAVAGRSPDAVVSGHVHNYQRFSRVSGRKKISYVVAGAGGYANDARSMHKLQKELRDEFKSGAAKLPFATTVDGVALEHYEEEDPGFLRISVTREKIDFEYFVVPFGDGAVSRVDAFSA